MKIHTAFLKRPLKFAVNVSLYAVHVGSVLQQYASLQGVGVMLHHVNHVGSFLLFPFCLS